MKLQKPAALSKGDTVAIVSPSWGGAALFPWVLERAERNLEKYFGLSVKELPHTRSDPKHLASHPEDRARDVLAAFEDPEVSGIVSAIGGEDSVRVLPHLDPAVFRRHPKILIGYSDTTTLLTMAYQAGLVTFHGPSMLAGWSQMDGFPPAFREQARAVLFGGPFPLTYPVYRRYSEGYPDWSDRANLGQVGPVQKNDGPHWVSAVKPFSGTLFGGNIETMEILKGTRYWPEPTFWEDKVLFLETSEEVPGLREVRRWLRNYALQGVFHRASGILMGRARGYSPEQKRDLDRVVREVIHEEAGLPGFPIVTNLDFGHTDPQWILPLGGRVRVDPRRGTIRLMESPTQS